MREELRFLAINCPTIDQGGFKGCPTSLLYAIGPLIEAIKAKPKCIPISGFSNLNIFDPTYYVEGKTVSDLNEKLSSIEPHIVAISTTSDSFQISVRMAETIKAHPNVTIVILGGPHCDEVDFDARDNNNPLVISNDFDFVIAGDGDYMLLRLVEIIANAMEESEAGQWSAAAIKEYVCKNDKEFKDVKGQARLYTEVNKNMVAISSSMDQLKLDEIPPLRFDYLKEEHLRDFDIFYKKIGDAKITKNCVQVLTHRGCTSYCNFCSERVLSFDQRGRYYNNSKTVQRIVSEIWHYVYEVGTEAVFFDDSTFMEDTVFVKRLCKKLIAEDLYTRISWGCLNRYDIIDNAEVIKLMVQAGLNYMYIGLESCDEEALRAMNKIRNKVQTTDLRNTQETQMIKIQNALNLLYDNGVRAGVSILFGHPYASEEGEKETIKFVGRMVEEKKIYLVSLSLFNYHLSSTLSQSHRQQIHLDYYEVEDKVALQNTLPWKCFEEGGWYHAVNRNISEDYLSRLLWEIAINIKEKDRYVLERRKEFEEFIKSSWAEKAKEAPEAYTIVLDFKDFNLSQYEIVTHYVRADKTLRRKLNEIATTIVNGMIDITQERQHCLFWGRPGSGKTVFCKRIAEEYEISFSKIDLTDFDMTEKKFKSDLNNLKEGGESKICLIDEIGANEELAWAYSAIKNFIDIIEEHKLPVTILLAGSQGANIKGLEKVISGEPGRNLGEDMLRRIPNRCEIPQVTAADKIVVFCSHIMIAASSMGKKITGVEKTVLYYILLDPKLHSAGELADFARTIVGRIPKGRVRPIYKDLFEEIDEESKEFQENPTNRDNMKALKDVFIKLQD